MTFIFKPLHSLPLDVTGGNAAIPWLLVFVALTNHPWRGTGQCPLTLTAIENSLKVTWKTLGSIYSWDTWILRLLLLDILHSSV